MHTLAVTAVVMMTITVYVPQAGGINGNMVTASGETVRTGLAACGPRYPFGAVFEIHEEMDEWALPAVVICADRGSAVGSHSLDLALVSDDVRRDLQTARQWGKRRRIVTIYPSLEAYEAARVLQRQLEVFGVEFRAP